MRFVLAFAWSGFLLCSGLLRSPRSSRVRICSIGSNSRHHVDPLQERRSRSPGVEGARNPFAILLFEDLVDRAAAGGSLAFLVRPVWARGEAGSGHVLRGTGPSRGLIALAGWVGRWMLESLLRSFLRAARALRGVLSAVGAAMVVLGSCASDGTGGFSMALSVVYSGGSAVRLKAIAHQISKAISSLFKGLLMVVLSGMLWNVAAYLAVGGRRYWQLLWRCFADLCVWSRRVAYLLPRAGHFAVLSLACPVAPDRMFAQRGRVCLLLCFITAAASVAAVVIDAAGEIMRSFLFDLWLIPVYVRSRRFPCRRLDVRVALLQ